MSSSQGLGGGDEEKVRDLLLDAALDELSDPAYPVLGGIQVAKVAHRAGVPERTARRHFKTEELRDALVARIFDVEFEHPEAFSLSDFETLERVISDRSASFGETIDGLAQWLVDANKTDPRTHAQWLLAKHASEDAKSGEAVAKLYQVQFSYAHAVVEEFLATHDDVLKVRPGWMSTYELAVLAFVIVEGFGFFAMLNEGRGRRSYGFSPELPGRAFKAAIASMFMIDGEDSFSVEDFFSAVDAARASGRAGVDHSE